MRIEPTAGQRRQIERKYGMFCHYGMNTYLDVEWSDGTAAPGTFAPPADFLAKVDTWAQLARDAGMRYLMLTTKHHDGFCLWPTAHTAYNSVAPEVGNKVDVVGAVAEACRRHGIELAMYYSIWDRHEPSYRDPDPHRYIDFMKGQLDELLTRYGPVCELWLDGQWDRKAEDWFLPEVYAWAKQRQPECQVGVNHTINRMPWLVREGEEVSYWPSDFRLYDPYLPAEPDRKIFLAGGQQVYLPFESTVTMSPVGNWFAHEGDPFACEVDVLEEIFFRATAQDNVLVINVSPRRSGELFPETRRNLVELAKRLGLQQGAGFPVLSEPRNLTYGATAAASSFVRSDRIGGAPANAVDANPQTAWNCAEATGWLELTLRRAGRFDCVVIVESTKAPVGRFSIEVETEAGWENVHRGEGLADRRVPTPAFSQRGYAKVRLGRTVVGRRVRVRIESSGGDGKNTPAIYQVGLHEG